MEDAECKANACKTVDNNCSKFKPKARGKKRKWIQCNSDSESDDGLPENALEVEKNLIASAAKNNLDDVSVKKILKKVVTNDHVLALVKLREEEESNTEESKLLPKLTRAKVKELNKVSPKTGPWNLQNLELTPIKHIPVKTRPEVKALIAQELPEDEDDEEYEPTHEDVPSDDDQCTESCSDLDSQPRTPATPRGQQRTSPKVVKDGPFKVPQDMSTPARRKLELMEEEATIALRTRSKLCLSETPIEHIESSSVLPDELPVPAVTDHLWNEFLNECLNPASVSKHEDDDETDPEYNVAADQDAPDDDDELERSIIKISKKELNDLVTELFNIIPEQTVEDELANISEVVLEDTTKKSTQSTHWEGKQEPTSDEEVQVKMVDRIVFERRSSISHSVGKTEPPDVVIEYVNEKDLTSEQTCEETLKNYMSPQTRSGAKVRSNVIDIEQKEGLIPQHSTKWAAPASVLHAQAAATTHSVRVWLDSTNTILPEQIQILQQQLRQHIQVATANFLQLCVHPIHWALGPTYKEYLLSLKKIGDSNPDSVVNVCNLQPAVELAETWEATVTKNTPENAEMVAFMQKESDRCMRRLAHNNTYVGMFHETFQRTVAQSSVFLYPYLLPCVPAREGPTRRYCYSRAEDELIVLGLDQFWDYVDNNPQIYKKPTRPQPRKRWGLSFAVDLVVKHMLPWLTTKVLTSHIQKARLIGDKDNPIVKFFANREVVPVKHVLLPYNPSLTLYEQPEYEMPRIWLRYLAKTSKRFRKHLYKPKTITGKPPAGVEVRLGLQANLPPKKPLPIQFTKEIVGCRLNVDEPRSQEIQPEKFNIEIQRNPPKEIAPMLLYKLVETSGGITLIPHQVEKDSIKPIGTNAVNCNVAPISSTIEVKKELIAKRIALKQKELDDPNHCKCCIMLRSIRKTKQKAITDYFKSTRRKDEECRCSVKKYPKITNRLRLLVDCYKIRTENIYRDLKKRVEFLSKCEDSQKEDITEEGRSNADDIAFVTAYLLKLTSRSSIAKNFYLKRRINNLFSKFDPDADNPIALAKSVGEAFKVELVDLFVEFLSFLTPEQAAKMGKFRQYFTLNCLEDLVEKVEEHVGDKASKLSIFTQLSSLFAGLWSPCQICSSLLPLMASYPPLAEYTFSIFPHWCRDYVVEATANGNATGSPGASPRVSIDQEQPEAEETLVEGDASQAMADYEADHSSSGDEDSRPRSVMAAPKLSPQETTTIPMPPLYNNQDFQPTCKTEPTDCDSSEMSMMIMSEDEPIKTEPPAWKRDEDKLILEVLKANLTPEEREDKTITEILEDEEVLEALADNLLNKTTEEVKERMVYLLNVLLLGGT